MITVDKFLVELLICILPTILILLRCLHLVRLALQGVALIERFDPFLIDYLGYCECAAYVSVAGTHALGGALTREAVFEGGTGEASCV